MSKRILILEDEVEACQYMEKVIKAEGWEVFTALTAQEAMDIFVRERPQACLIDVHLPLAGMDGMDVLKRIKFIEKNTKCIMVTCVDEEDLGERAKEAGADGYFQKPFNADKLRKIVEAVS